ESRLPRCPSRSGTDAQAGRQTRVAPRQFRGSIRRSHAPRAHRRWRGTARAVPDPDRCPRYEPARRRRELRQWAGGLAAPEVVILAVTVMRADTILFGIFGVVVC